MARREPYHVGYYINRYASWYRVAHFNSAVDLVRWLKANASGIDGAIDFISYKPEGN